MSTFAEVAAPQDSQTDEIARNRRATARLLASLIEHHGIVAEPAKVELTEPAPRSVETPIVVEPVTVETVEVCVLPVPEPMLTIDGIKRAVCSHYGVTHSDLVSPRRGSRIVWPRQMAMYLCREFTSRSLPEIARKFGNRDHTTALHAVNKVRIKIHADAAVAAEVSHFREYLSA